MSQVDASGVSEPAQCSLWFDTKSWSKRYADTFYTATVVGHSVVNGAAAFAVEMKAGAANVWRIEKSDADFEAFASEVASQLASAGDAFVVPDLPAKKWTILSADVSEEYLTQRTASYADWLHRVLGGTRQISVLPSVRRFLDLDRQLIKEEEEEYVSDDENNENETEQKAQ